MILVAVNDENSFNNIAKWMEEIRYVTTQAPFFLILTKSDMDGPVNLKKLKGAKEEDPMILNCFKTSSKEWDDFNVHKAFNKTLAGALKYHAEDKDDYYGGGGYSTVKIEPEQVT